MTEPPRFMDTKEGKLVGNLVVWGGVLSFLAGVASIVTGYIFYSEWLEDSNNFWGGFVVFGVSFLLFLVGIGLIVTGKKLEIEYKNKEL